MLTIISKWSYPLLLMTVLFVFFSLPAFALEVPELKGRVNDYAGMLSTGTITQLDAILANLETTDSSQIVVLTIPSLEGDSLEGFSLKTVEKWQIGQKNIDNGALLLISRDDRKLRIEVGYGLEGSMTDMVSGQIIRNVITPQFRNGNFDQGVIDGVGAMVAVVKGEYQAVASSRTRSAPKNDLGGLITSLVFIYFFFGSMFRKNKLAAAAIGGLASPVLAFLLFSFSGFSLIILAFIGVIGGLITSSIASNSANAAASGRGGRGFYIGSGGGFGGSSGGFGGFSGGGGGFGGGGASGGW